MPNSVFNYLHSAVIPFRAAENGVPIVWAECQSLSMIVDSDGRILARGPEKAPAFIIAGVHLRSGLTFFTRAGDYFAYLCVTGCVLGSILSTRSRSRKP
jgi:apolipoprotein N-acyltransferase